MKFGRIDRVVFALLEIDNWLELTDFIPARLRSSFDATGQATEQANATAQIITDYLIDQSNHTCYAQVLEETTGSSMITYTIADDVIAQCATGGATEYLLYDGHGSTRQLLNTDLTVADSREFKAPGAIVFGTIFALW